MKKLCHECVQNCGFGISVSFSSCDSSNVECDDSNSEDVMGYLNVVHTMHCVHNYLSSSNERLMHHFSYTKLHC